MRMPEFFARTPGFAGALPNAAHVRSHAQGRVATRLLSLTSLALPLVLAASALAEPQTFKVDGSGASKIQFVSDAPLEKFTGSSTAISGEIKVDPAKPIEGKGEIKLEVASLKTGLSLRDEHLHGEGWLDAPKFPQAKFAITKITGVSALKPNEAAEAQVVGKFTLHGVTTDATSTAKVRLIPAEGAKPASLRVLATFKVKLEDHKVSVPSVVALKVAPEVLVNVDIVASAAAVAAPTAAAPSAAAAPAAVPEAPAPAPTAAAPTPTKKKKTK